MATYDFQQLQQLWIDAGGPPEVAPVMAALALQQSGGSPGAADVTAKESSHGIWQINTDPNANPQFASWNLNDPQTNAKAAVELYKKDGLGPWSLVPANPNDPYGKAVENPIIAAWNANGGAQGGQNAAQAALTASGHANGQDASVLHVARAAANSGGPGAMLTSDTTTTQGTPSAGSAGQAVLPGTVFEPPLPGANPKNFHGYDLSAIPSNELGNAERAIQQYITDPGYAQQIQQRISQDYGYHGNWIEKIPEVNGLVIWAAATLDPATAAGQNAFLSAIANTNWWKSTTQNQRAWEQAQATDPATAHEAIIQAQAHVLATANQLGVKLSQSELNAIANGYAAQSYTPTGVLGSQSGTSQEWLDQAVVDTALNVKQNKGYDFSGLPAGQSNLLQETQGGNNPAGMFGITSQLFNQLQGVAQQYLMYNPKGGSLLNNQDLMGYVQHYIRNWTGSNSFGSSNLINGAVQDFTQQMMDQASRYYPSLSDAIKAGTTPQSYAAGYTNTIAQTLGLDPQSINYNSPQWNWVLGTPDPKTNKKVALTLDQVQSKLVTDPRFGYDKTNNAKQTALDITAQLNQLMGFGGQ